ncbi:unnamed protein product, partial [Rotaria socialis]
MTCAGYYIDLLSDNLTYTIILQIDHLASLFKSTLTLGALNHGRPGRGTEYKQFSK